MSKIKIYIPFSIAVLKSNYLAYKSRFILWIGAHIVIFLAQIFLWIAIFNNSASNQLNGFTKESIISYVIISKIFESLTYCSLEQQVSRDVRNGNITISLIKPINYRTELLFRAFGQILGSLMFFLPIYLIVYLIFVLLGKAIFYTSLVNIIFFILFMVIAFTLNYLISLIFSSVIFKTIKSQGIYEFKKIVIGFFSGSIIPLSFYPNVMKNILEYSFFSYLRYMPIKILQNNLNINDILINFSISILWIFILFFIAFIIWKVQIKKIVYFGG